MDNWLGWAKGSWLGWEKSSVIPPTPSPSVTGDARYITTPKEKVRNFRKEEEAALIAWFLDDDG